MTKLRRNLNSGLTLVEVMIATSIILVFLIAIFSVHNLYLRTAFSSGEVVKAAALTEESLEAMRFLRNNSWNNNIAPLTRGTEYGLVFSAGNWSTSTSDVWVDNFFKRTVVLSDVYRDASGDIVSSGGVLDANTVLIVSNVAWPDRGATTTKSISTYLTNLID